MSDGIRSGIIGTGFMGQVHARAIRAAGGTVTAVFSRSPDAAASAAARFGAERGVTSLKELLADDVDLVHVCTPNAAHYDQAAAALAAGKHVVCEKPLASNVSEAQALVDQALVAGVVTAVPFAYRFYAAVREARERIRRGDAGQLRLLHGSYLQDWLSRPGDTNWRVDVSAGGRSRAFGDIGVHWCDLAEFVSGHRITRLSAKLLALPRGAEAVVPDTEDAATVLFETDHGAIGSIVISQVSPGRKNRLWLSVDGADASYQFDQEQPDSLWIGARESNTVLPRAADSAVAPGRFDMVPAGHPQGYQDSFTLLMADVHAAVRGELPDGLPTFADGLRAAKVTDAVLNSATTGDWVELDR
jgi:predicted dehydrogenase